MKTLKQFFCKHTWTYVHPINAKNPGTWRCTECWLKKADG